MELVGIRHESCPRKVYLKFSDGFEVECPDEEVLEEARKELASKQPKPKYTTPELPRHDRLRISLGKGLRR